MALAAGEGRKRPFPEKIYHHITESSVAAPNQQLRSSPTDLLQLYLNQRRTQAVNCNDLILIKASLIGGAVYYR